MSYNNLRKLNFKLTEHGCFTASAKINTLKIITSHEYIDSRLNFTISLKNSIDCGKSGIKEYSFQSRDFSDLGEVEDFFDALVVAAGGEIAGT